MSAEELTKSFREYTEQLTLINEALRTAGEGSEKESLISLQSDLNQLLQLTQESLDAVLSKDLEVKPSCSDSANGNDEKSELDDEYALFMAEMSKSGAYDNKNKPASSNDDEQDGNSDASDIEDELATLLGMKCAVYHTHKWGGQPTLYNAMVSSVVPRQDEDQFSDLQVRILFTHPTHAEMLPCPFFLNGECRFDDEQCRYSHGAAVPLSSLKEAIEPDFKSVKINSRVLVKLKPPDDEDTSLTRKSTEKYHLWHRAVVNSINEDKRLCFVKLEHQHKSGKNNKSDEFAVQFEELFPLNSEEAQESDSDDSLSDTEYAQAGPSCADAAPAQRALLAERSLHTAGPAMGEWERHTRGIGSKLMLAMGYVPGTGLGAACDGRLAPVEARAVPVGRSLDHCMALSERAAGRDPLKVEQKLKRLQRKEEEKNKRAYEREKERERRNVFNFLNKTLGDNSSEADTTPTGQTPNIKQSTNKDLNIEQLKLEEETKRLERELIRLNSSLQRNPLDKNLNLQIGARQKELEALRNKEKQISNEQRQRKDQRKMTVF